MKRNLLIALMLAGFVQVISGQDRIITINHDTIDCRITRIARDAVCFDIMTKGVKTSGQLPASEIYSYNIMPSSVQERGTRYTAGIATGRLRLGLNGGSGYILSSTDDAENELIAMGVSGLKAEAYYRDLKTGFSGSADATWVFSFGYGAGIRYRFFNTAAVTEGSFDAGDGINILFCDYRENIFTNYAGVSLFYQEPVGKKKQFSLYSSLSLGMAFYLNMLEFFTDNLVITGNAPGMDGTIGIECRLTPVISAAAEASVFAATLKKIEITDGEQKESVELPEENYENLSRMEFTLGIRFYFGK
jgi:hypothetical protein